MNSISERIQVLYPKARGGVNSWDPDKLQVEISGLLDTYNDIADRKEVKYQDRAKMDNAVQSIVGYATEVNELMRRVLELEANKPGLPRDWIPQDDVKLLLAGPGLQLAEEELCRKMLVRLLDNPSIESGSLTLRLSDLCEYPELVSVVTDFPGESAEMNDSYLVTRVQDIADAVQGAAVLLNSQPVKVPDRLGGGIDFLTNALELRCRTDLVRRLAPVLPPSKQQQIRRDAENLTGRIFEVSGRIQEVARRLDEAAFPEAKELFAIREELDQQKDSGLPDLALGWAKAVFQFADQLQAYSISELRKQIATLGDAERKQAEGALGAGRIAEARVALGHRDTIPEIQEADAVREVMWRKQAVETFQDPIVYLEDNLRLAAPLIELWTKRAKVDLTKGDRHLRSRFAEFVFTERVGGVALHKMGVNEPREWRISFSQVAEAMKRLNPTFLPQIHRFENLVLLTPATSTASELTFAKDTASIAASYRSGVPVVLVPKLSSERRQQLLRELRKTDGLVAAVIDDVDFCRLVDAAKRQHNLMLGLLEIMFEQVQLSRLMPFNPAQEGQHVLMEMFVGRKEEAEELCHTTRYTQVFSGRKLGKSALLRFVERQRDGGSLPSGCVLRVVYRGLVGASSEPDVVNIVRREIKEKLGFEPRNPSARGDSANALVQLFDEFVTERPKESLLIVLDEADLFVESQLEEYERHREKCLSFQMRSRIESHKDSKQHPRVRFIFAGYRCTNTREGAWANWGDSLVLDPLRRTDAIGLIEGPLARLGVMTGTHAANIAFRCGYQPAVILRFGERLIKHLNDTEPMSRRESISISDEDVSTIFRDNAVQDEIRTIVKNNFTDNPVGRIVFSALLLIFSELPPGSELDDGPARVLERLREVEGETDWLTGDDRFALVEIERQVRQLTERKLLQDRPGTSEDLRLYRLGFPHHLGILLQTDQENAIHTEVEVLRKGGGAAHRGNARALVSPKDLQFAEILRPDHNAEFPVRLVVVTSLWPEAVNHQSGGVPDRLGIEPSCQITRANAERALERPTVAVLNATPKTGDFILQKRGSALPPVLLTGGADLLRWALERQQSDWIEVIGLGRMNRAVLAWWFERIRGLEFPRPDAIDQLLSLTSGIPLLVRILDELLVPDATQEGTTSSVSQVRLDELQLEFPKRLRDEVGKLRLTTDAAWRMMPRELEIIRMLSVVHNTGIFRPGDRLSDHLSRNWRLYSDSCPLEPIGPADTTPLAVLQYLGFVPSRPDQSISVPADSVAPLAAYDALLGVVEALGT